MTVNQETARIIQFPTGGRRETVRNRDATWRAGNLPARKSAKIVFDGGWYHEDAIREDERARNTLCRLPTRP